MIKIEKIVFYRTGEIVRDLGLLYFNRIISEMKTKQNNSKLESSLQNNYLEIRNFNKNEFYNYLVNTKIFQVFLNGIKPEFKNMDSSFLNEISVENFIERVNNHDGLSEKSKSNIIKKFGSKYFQYIRNSGKYGANAQSEENFHKNLEELVNIVYSLSLNIEEDNQKSILKEYEPLNAKCMVCHTFFTTKYDITHHKEKKERKDSKYNYWFMSSEKNTFRNYADSNSTVCFTCEFFNLMFLLYLSLERPQILAYTDSLNDMEFINYKIMLTSKEFNDNSLHRKLGRLRNTKIRLFNIYTDTNKGILISFNSIVEFDNLIKNIKLSALTDRFIFTKEGSNKRIISKTLIRNSNYEGLKSLFFSEIFVLGEEGGDLDTKKTINNIEIWLELICMLGGEKILKDNEFEILGSTLGNITKKEAKKTIAFKINQMLRADNRNGLFDILGHLIVTNGVTMPKNFAKIIIYGDQDIVHYNIGKFLEKFLNTDNKEE